MEIEKNRPNFIVGIAGGSGSGKTTFIHKLRESFSKTEIALISQDNYYLEKEKQLIDANGVVNYDLPTSIDMDAFFADIKALKCGTEVRRKEYTFNNELKTPDIIVIAPAPIIIAEGLFLFNEKRFQSIFDLRVMIDATDDRKIIRRIKRDRIERNYPLEDVLYRYEHHVVPAYNAFISPYKDEVDLIVNNNSNFNQALDVLKAFMKSIIA